MSKYYTPEIEEFYVGFEFETKRNVVLGTLADSGYSYAKKNKPNLTMKEYVNMCPYFPEVFRADQNANSINKKLSTIRVKYLAREDIESLGWKYYKTHPGMEQMEFDKGEFNLTYDPDFRGKQWLRIAMEGDGDVTLFAGTIKNKSELKRLLKQLGI